MEHPAFGHQGRDKITGFSGTIVGRCAYMSGCAQFLLVPKVGADGKVIEGQWFDEQRVEIVGDERIVLQNEKTPGADNTAKPRRY